MRTFLLLLVALVAASPARAEVNAELLRLQRWLWPTSPGIEAAPGPAPSETPRASAETDTRQVLPISEADSPAARHSPKRSGRPRARPQPRADDGPDLPYPCWQVRLFSAGKTRAQLEAAGKEHGVTLSAKQRKQAAACLGRG
ncbi:MAG: hypothetical protein IT537_03110 [Hyphomicrobiales bacterium]|nr:hypothetical protein [Hyphomicrobiales bacterium]